MDRRKMNWCLKMIAKPTAGNVGGPYYCVLDDMMLNDTTDDINFVYQVKEIEAKQNPLFDFVVEEYR